MITVTDLFCGAGGSGLGATAVPGVELQLAANHSELAIDTHAANFPDCEHDVADISQVRPERYRRSNLLWASPECTWQSGARGKRRDDDPQAALFGDDPNEVAERSRSTMWDVPRFTEWHYYDAVIVENVVETVTKWPLWPAWVHAMQCLGYQVTVVSLNSMHAPAQAAPRAPQSRDRIYAVCTPASAPSPDLEPRPTSWCARCDALVGGVQWWKRHPAPRAGKYGPQYAYRCGTCRELVEPLVTPASAAIDWALPGQRIGDRAKPLAPATIARIQRGLDRFAGPSLVPSGGSWNETAASVADLPHLRTRTADEPLPTMTSVDTAGLAFIAELRGGGSTARAVSQPFATVTAAGNHHMLVRNNGTRDGGRDGQMCTPVNEPTRTITTTGHQSLVGWDRVVPTVEDCTYRMLGVDEIAAAMAFRPGYVVKGTKRDRVRQLGNAVTPPAAEFLIRRVLDVVA